MSLEHKSFTQDLHDAANELLELCAPGGGAWKLSEGTKWNVWGFPSLLKALGHKLLRITSVTGHGITALDDIGETVADEIRMTIADFRTRPSVTVTIRYPFGTMDVQLIYEGDLASDLKTDRLFGHWLAAFLDAVAGEHVDFPTFDATFEPIKPAGIDAVTVVASADSVLTVDMTASTLAKQLEADVLPGAYMTNWDLYVESTFDLGSGAMRSTAHGHCEIGEQPFELTMEGPDYSVVQAWMEGEQIDGTKGEDRVTRTEGDVVKLHCGPLQKWLASETAAAVFTNLNFTWTEIELSFDWGTKKLTLEAHDLARYVINHSMSIEDTTMYLEAKLVKGVHEVVYAAVDSLSRYEGKEWLSWYEVEISDEGDGWWRRQQRGERIGMELMNETIPNLAALCWGVVDLFTKAIEVGSDGEQVLVRDEQRGGGYGLPKPKDQGQ